jgi:hypothetical protein
MWFRHRAHAKRRRRRAAAPSDVPASPSDVPAAPPAAVPDDIAMPRTLEEGPPIVLDRLVPDALRVGWSEAGLREPPALIVEGPEGAARRRARDERDGVEVVNPRRGPLYVLIAFFVAMLVFAVLSLIETRELSSLLP